MHQSYLCSVASTIFSLSNQFDRHSHGHRDCQPTHMFVVLSNAVGPIDFYVILLGRVPTFHSCVRQICMDLRKNCYRSVFSPCHTRYTTSLVVHLHSSAFFAFDLFFVDFQFFSKFFFKFLFVTSYNYLTFANLSLVLSEWLSAKWMNFLNSSNSL